MDDQAAFSELVGCIYDAVDQPAHWDRLLHRFADTMQGTVTHLILYNCDDQAGSVAAAVRAGPESAQLYNDHYVYLDQWAVHGHQKFASGAVNLGQELCPDGILERSEFYGDYLRPLGIFHNLSGIISMDGHVASVIATTRPRSAKPFSERERGMLRSLMPHLQRALTLHRHFGALRSQTGWCEQILDRMPTGVVLMSAQQRVLFANAKAREIFAQRDGLDCDAQGLSAARAGDTRHIQRLVKSAIATARGTSADPGGLMMLPRPSGRRSYQLLVSPCRSSLEWHGISGSAATIFITDPESKSEPPVVLLERLYGLTHAEARLTALLAGGSSLAEAAEQLHVTDHTVRAHLKRVFAKTGTRRQSELVRAVLLSAMYQH